MPAVLVETPRALAVDVVTSDDEYADETSKTLVRGVGEDGPPCRVL